MKTTVTHRDGTVGHYDTRTQEQLDLVLGKHKKLRLPAERRLYPPKAGPYGRGWTTRGYVEAYFALNTNMASNPTYAYSRHEDHISLYLPLGTTAQYWPVDE